MPFDVQPLPYHVSVADFLQHSEPDLWTWFSSEDFASKYKVDTDAELLRTALRLERRGGNVRRYELAELARDRLGLDAPIRLYQMQDSGGVPNAFLVFVAGEIVICFAGRILELLEKDAELLDVLGHEISHYRLFVANGGRFYTADRLLRWFLMRDDCAPEFVETWRRYRLFTEVYCDLGGLIASCDKDATIQGLVKAIADFKEADAQSYRRQLDELIASGPGVSRGTTHPELHVRVHALAKAGELPPNEFNEAITNLIVPPLDLATLDVLQQRELQVITRRLIDRIVGRLSTPACEVLRHARTLFADYQPPTAPPAPLPPVGSTATESLRHYLTYLMLDFGSVGRDLTVMALVADVADEIGLGALYRETARRELKGRRTLLTGLKSQAATAASQF
jgi:hypothetical protein